MINCRIISVNTNDIESDKSVQNIGHQKNEGRKIRYVKRREKIEEFVKNTSIDGMNMEIFDAVTPKDFSFDSGKVYYKGNEYANSTEAELYIANTLSNFEIWNMEEDTLVLEDDVLFDVDVLREIQILCEEFKEVKIPNKLLYLLRSCPWKKGTPDRFYQTVKINDRFGIPTSPHDMSGNGAYFATSKTKEIILRNMKPIKESDGMMGDLNNSKVLTYCIPNNIESMIRLDPQTTWL